MLANRPEVLRERVERTCTLMEAWGRDWQVAEYLRLILVLVLPDEKDRHVLAAAIASKVPIIVTFNLSDFPDAVLAPYGIRAVSPDDFLVELLEATPDAFVSAVHSHRLALKNPPYTAEEYLARFVASGLRKTANRLEDYRMRL